MTHARISDPESLTSKCSKGTGKSSLRKDLPIPWTHYDPSDPDRINDPDPNDSKGMHPLVNQGMVIVSCAVKLESRSLNIAQRKVQGRFFKFVKYHPSLTFLFGTIHSYLFSLIMFPPVLYYLKHINYK